jgi:hypothetical protein
MKSACAKLQRMLFINKISLPVPVERKMVIRVPSLWVIIAEE